MRVFERTVASIVDENYIYARALSSLGIEFYQYPDSKLSEICSERGLNKERVIRSFYLFDRAHRLSFTELDKCPLEVVIQYLKHAHHIFIKDKLPYIAQLIHQFDRPHDLRLIFPDFVAEFISHIYEEEDSLFAYISDLIAFDRKKLHNPLKDFWNIKGYSLQAIYEHHCEEDELAGIRGLVEESEFDSLHWRIIAQEIKAFDREMWYHAQVENKILFPKSIALETKVKATLQKLSGLN